MIDGHVQLQIQGAVWAFPWYNCFLLSLTVGSYQHILECCRILSENFDIRSAILAFSCHSFSFLFIHITLTELLFDMKVLTFSL